MKAILMSIQPKWLVKILNGEKTIEIRKSMPKCELPIDVYLYCTKGTLYFNSYENEWQTSRVDRKLLNPNLFHRSGKVVAKFTLNKVEMIRPIALGSFLKTSTLEHKEIIDKSCLTENEIRRYLTNMYGDAWHISKLEIFDKPKELGEFYYYKKRLIDCGMDCPPYTDWVEYRVYKAPQSWQYVYVEVEK